MHSSPAIDPRSLAPPWRAPSTQPGAHAAQPTQSPLTTNPSRRGLPYASVQQDKLDYWLGIQAVLARDNVKQFLASFRHQWEELSENYSPISIHRFTSRVADACLLDRSLGFNRHDRYDIHKYHDRLKVSLPSVHNARSHNLLVDSIRLVSSSSHTACQPLAPSPSQDSLTSRSTESGAYTLCYITCFILRISIPALRSLHHQSLLPRHDLCPSCCHRRTPLRPPHSSTHPRPRHHSRERSLLRLAMLGGLRRYQPSGCMLRPQRPLLPLLAHRQTSCLRRRGLDGRVGLRCRRVCPLRRR
jgi:hypothetical protein